MPKALLETDPLMCAGEEEKAPAVAKETALAVERAPGGALQQLKRGPAGAKANEEPP